MAKSTQGDRLTCYSPLRLLAGTCPSAGPSARAVVTSGHLSVTTIYVMDSCNAGSNGAVLRHCIQWDASYAGDLYDQSAALETPVITMRSQFLLRKRRSHKHNLVIPHRGAQTRMCPGTIAWPRVLRTARD